MACRGTGKIISHLGGTPTTVTCPWCRGGGARLAEINAQAAWQEGEPERPDSSPEPRPPGGAAA